MCSDSPRFEVASFYRGRSIFVTGGSGFMGKVLLEKLMYSLPDVETIYTIMRPKRGKTVEARIEEMFKLPLFGRLRKERPEAMKKLVVLEGDITLDNLSLSEEDTKRVQEEVSVVFHCAATLKLEANLKDSCNMNLTGTWRVIQLCRGIKNLKALVHLSTAFTHCDQAVMEEKVYPPPHNPHDIMQCCRWMDLDSLEKITPKLLTPHPNTYTYTKRLAEKLIADEFPKMPVAIARPSIVTAAYEEPCEGWVDNLNGPTGILVAAGKGVLRSMYCFGDTQAEIIPVDHAISAIIAIGAKVGSQPKPHEIPVFNMTVSSVKPITWQEVLDIGRRLIYKFPFELMAWYPDGNIHRNYYYHMFLLVFLHFLPAVFVDSLMFIFRQKRFMMRVQWKIYEGLDLLQFFTTRQWNFASSKFLALRDDMSDPDKKIFPMRFEEIDNTDYILKTVLGSRQYCMKEDLSSLPRARRTLKLLWVVDKIWSLVFWGTILWMIYSYSETVRYGMDAVGGSLKYMPGVRLLVDRAN